MQGQRSAFGLLDKQDNRNKTQLFLSVKKKSHRFFPEVFNLLATFKIHFNKGTINLYLDDTRTNEKKNGNEEGMKNYLKKKKTE